MHTFSWKKWASLGAIAVLLLASGCGKSDSGSAGDGRTASASPSPSSAVEQEGSASPGTTVLPSGSPIAEVSPSPKPSTNFRPSLDSTSIRAQGDNPWTLEAGKVEYDQDTQRAVVSQVKWALCDKKGNTRITVVGDSAQVNIATKGVAFDGPVTATGAEGEKLTVQHLEWNSTKQKLIGTGGVRLERENSTLTGDRLESSPDLKKVSVIGNVRVIFPQGLPQDSAESSYEGW